MFKRKILKIILSVLGLTVVYSSFALSTEEKGYILESFKNLEYEMLFESDAWILDDEDKNALNLSRRVNIFWDIKDSEYLFFNSSY